MLEKKFDNASGHNLQLNLLLYNSGVIVPFVVFFVVVIVQLIPENEDIQAFTKDDSAKSKDFRVTGKGVQSFFKYAISAATIIFVLSFVSYVSYLNSKLITSSL